MYSNKFKNLHKCKCNLLNVICYLEFDFCKFLLLLLIFFNILRLVGVRVHPIYVDFFSLINEFLKHLGPLSPKTNELRLRETSFIIIEKLISVLKYLGFTKVIAFSINAFLIIED